MTFHDDSTPIVKQVHKCGGVKLGITAYVTDDANEND